MRFVIIATVSVAILAVVSARPVDDVADIVDENVQNPVNYKVGEDLLENAGKLVKDAVKDTTHPAGGK
jgi:hypothetical protein